MTDPTASGIALPDLHSEPPLTAIPVQEVGHQGVVRALLVCGDPVLAYVDVSVGLPSNQRGAHMSRLIDALPNGRRVGTLQDFVLSARDDLKAVTPESNYWKVSARAVRLYETHEGLKPVEEVCTATAEVRGSAVREHLSVGSALKVCLVCPQAQAVIAHLDNGTPAGVHPSHNQLCELTMTLDGISADDAVSFTGAAVPMAEAAASGQVRERHKRLGEGLAVEEAHRRPRFAEDALRDLARALRDRFSSAARIRCKIVNYESIFEYPLICRVEL